MDGMRPIGRSVASVIVPGLPEPFPFVPERPPRAEVLVPDYPSFCGTDEEFQVAIIHPVVRFVRLESMALIMGVNDGDVRNPRETTTFPVSAG